MAEKTVAKHDIFDLAYDFRNLHNKKEELQNQQVKIDQDLAVTKDKMAALEAEIYAYCKDEGLLESHRNKYILKAISQNDYLLIDLTANSWRISIIHQVY